MIYYLKPYQLCFPFFMFLIFIVACNDLERKLNLIEERVLNETAFGRQMGEYMKSKNTPYILDPDLLSQARYSIADDKLDRDEERLGKRDNKDSRGSIGIKNISI